jgi:hypothetical protein
MPLNQDTNVLASVGFPSIGVVLGIGEADAEQVSPRTSTRRHGQDAVLACLGAAWSAFLLPPVVVAWDGAAAPDWAHHLTGAAPYDWIRSVAARAGAPGDYEAFGVLVAPAFLLIGLALLPRARVAGRWTGLLAWLTLLGAPVVALSYVGHALPEPWHLMWGWEIPLLAAMAICCVVAGVFAFRPHRLPLWWAALLAATVSILAGSTALFTYFPHGSLIGYGLGVAVLALGEPRVRLAATPSSAVPPA